MSMMIRGLRGLAIAATIAITSVATAFAADYPAPKQGVWVAKDFKFHTGEVLPELKLGYTTVGEPSGEPVLILHGTTGSAASMLTPAFAGELFGPGQPLDASRYYVILTDSIGAGTSAKPSDGLRAKFPRYNYDDMVRAQYDLVTQGLGVKHLRMIIGYSMGGMHAWLWSSKYPDMMDIVVPMASQPTEMSSRNWMMRRMIIDAVRNDPDWKGGDYTEQPKAVQVANVYFGIATNGGNIALQNMAPTREKADALLDSRLKAPLTVDANDYMYQWDASRDYNAAAGLDKITATVLAINSADDERNPPETGIMDREIKRVKNGRVLLIPASADTRGHATLAMAKFYAKEIAALLATAPRAGNP
ncbi:alpha/beta fold hydrolase [Ancylobacter polymorphus]|uniref:Homoserine O-acetyltransferase n=1 Tax=Ancylobacter polymorphus TaxID=223390 RepID=A0ABU0BA24_9HYPH|nr:homoserine O-acetyltransferase [Ancylobacter polymorphus]